MLYDIRDEVGNPESQQGSNFAERPVRVLNDKPFEMSKSENVTRSLEGIEKMFWSVHQEPGERAWVSTRVNKRQIVTYNDDRDSILATCCPVSGAVTILFER